MQPRAFFKLIIVSLTLTICSKSRAQCPSGNAPITIQLECGASCSGNLTFTIADLRNTSDYIVLENRPYLPYLFDNRTVAGLTFTGPPNWYRNAYTAVQDLPFTFCFFDSVYTQFVVGANGCISFDTSMALKFCEPRVAINNNPRPLPSAAYARALIAAVMQDLDPADTGRVATGEKVEYRIEGTAPCRRAVISYYNVPVWWPPNAPISCVALNTHQMVLHEGTGIIDVYQKDKNSCAQSSGGLSILGIQNWGPASGPDKFEAPLRRNAGSWGGNNINESVRFLPSGGPQRFIRAELWDGPRIIGTTTTTTPAGQGEMTVTFNPVCPAASTSFLLMKAIYSSCDGTGNIEMVDTVRINRSTELHATAEVIPASCGGSNGVIIMHVPGGSGVLPYSYSINSGPFGPDSVFSGLTPGFYDVVVNDAGNCSTRARVQIRSSTTLFPTFTVTPTSCNLATDGTITATVVNGNPPFRYSFNSGPFQTNNVFTNLPAGFYTIDIEDATGCKSNSLVEVVRGAPLSISVAATPTSCSGANNGTITVTTLNGNAPYQFQLNTNPPQASNVFTNLPPGNYRVTVTDASGCNVTNIFVDVLPGSALTGTFVKNDPACGNSPTGNITVNVSNGTAPYQYSLDNVNFQASNVFTGLVPGTYTVYINDNNACSGTITNISLVTAPPLTGTFVKNDPTCGSSPTGNITVNISNGTAPYQYSLDNINFQAGNVFNGLVPGTYTVYMRDNTGCTGTITNITLAAAAPLTGTFTKNDPACGGPTGSITVNISNGTGPYQYSLDNINFQAANTFNGLTAGTYTVYIGDNFGCSGTVANITLTSPPMLTIDAAPQAVRCIGQTNGSITITAGGGTPTYQYSMDGINFQASNVFNGLAPGTYTVYVDDSRGCRAARVNIVITEPTAVQFTTTTQNATCGGGNDGQIIVTASGGTPPYQYSSDGTTFQASNILLVAPGTHSAYVRDANGCTLAPQTNITVGLNDNLAIRTLNDTSICQGRSITLTTVSNAATYTWRPGTGLSSTTVANPVATPTATTTYIVDAVLGPCLGSDTIIVTVMPAPVAAAGADESICLNDSIQLSGAGGVIYQWSPSVGLSNATIANPFAKPTQTTTYNLLVTDANGCTSLASDAVAITVIRPPNVNITKNSYVSPGEVIKLHAEGGTSYLWTPPTGLDNPNIAEPNATITQDITYRVLVTTAEGCEAEDSVSIRAFKGPDIYMPSAFTPNKDGRNDRFVPIAVGIKEITYFSVYNRWGQLVYTTKKLHEGWDGRHNGLDLDTGVFVWIVQGITNDGKVIFKRGTVTLIR